MQTEKRYKTQPTDLNQENHWKTIIIKKKLALWAEHINVDIQVDQWQFQQPIFKQI